MTKFFCAMRKRVCSSLMQLSMMANASSSERPFTYSRSITDNVNAAPYPCAPYGTWPKKPKTIDTTYINCSPKCVDRYLVYLSRTSKVMYMRCPAKREPKKETRLRNGVSIAENSINL